jgi:enoyl-CoA hydratase/carnithine racemase
LYFSNQKDYSEIKIPMNSSKGEIKISHLLYEKNGMSAKITLNRPEALNAFSLPMIKGWAEALQDAQEDHNIRVVVVTAVGKAFCAGRR